MKRKRKSTVTAPTKHPRLDAATVSSPPAERDHPVLRCYYSSVLPLRQYVLSKLPSLAKTRKQVLSVAGRGEINNENVEPDELGETLDSLLVGVRDAPSKGEEEARSQELVTFSQQLSESASALAPASFHQSEIVDFVIWLLFKRHAALPKPPHLLCNGFQRASAAGQNGMPLSIAPGIPGLIATHPNSHVETVKNPVWSKLLEMLGEGGDHIMLHLLLDCGIFKPVDSGRGNYVQLSGFPLSSLKSVKDIPKPPHPKSVAQKQTAKGKNKLNKLTDIKFVRSRMLYARPALNPKGNVRFGLGHIRECLSIFLVSRI
ncbi:hypothetical protein K402DRAFT_218825 [Aulographum hederae CBS 113979]|uniref:Telomerase reverse transcriptase n=1 Tax=Aulographum hederae CBS 113979 TaxID=1176131 RepID=A0A6G1GLP6_9PEZI|nr:hypothetical protein K402DRAFT_218825 [Aulographum hederae CBS 113979]